MVDRIIGSSAIAPKPQVNPAIARFPGRSSNAPVVLVIDTNLWLDLLVFHDPSTNRLARWLARGLTQAQGLGAEPIRLQVIGCAPMRAELADVIGRAKFRLETPARQQVLAAWDESVTLEAVAPDCGLPCTDPDDRKFLDLAIAHRVDWLLSRDRALLAARKPAGRRFGVRIGKLADFYNWLDVDHRPDTAGAPPPPPPAPSPSPPPPLR